MTTAPGRYPQQLYDFVLGGGALLSGARRAPALWRAG
jgi:hypothetical protein